MKSGRILIAVLFVLALSVLLAAGYATAYIARGEYIDWRVSRMELVERQYPQGWMATLFQPAARVESRWIGCEVMLTYTETSGAALVR